MIPKIEKRIIIPYEMRITIRWELIFQGHFATKHENVYSMRFIGDRIATILMKFWYRQESYNCITIYRTLHDFRAIIQQTYCWKFN